ncbi:MAG TPA: hypothetical protein EYN00_09425, partial [Planctomycetes bacterium]|nr:hypothetical protein [Planctomycetota bacterium]
EDFTTRKRHQEELVKQQRLESIGRLAGGLAHDFNNFLTIILGNLNIAQVKLATGDGVRDELEIAAKACMQASGITKQMLTFSKGGGSHHQDRLGHGTGARVGQAEPAWLEDPCDLRHRRGLASRRDRPGSDAPGVREPDAQRRPGDARGGRSGDSTEARVATFGGRKHVWRRCRCHRVDRSGGRDPCL